MIKKRMKKWKPNEISESQFEKLVRQRLYQLQRSKLERKKIEKELENIKTPEEAKAYIKLAGMITVNEVKAKNMRQRDR